MSTLYPIPRVVHSLCAPKSTVRPGTPGGPATRFSFAAARRLPNRGEERHIAGAFVSLEQQHRTRSRSCGFPISPLTIFRTFAHIRPKGQPLERDTFQREVRNQTKKQHLEKGTALPKKLVTWLVPGYTKQLCSNYVSVLIS